MIVEQAPQFGASGNFLAASYSLDFAADLSHYMLTEGTWGGDRVTCRALYLDNYNNNFALTVSSGQTSTKVPAYSEGFVNLIGFQNVTVTSEGASTVRAYLTTEDKPTGFNARGQAPNIPTVTPYSVLGSFSLSSSNTTTRHNIAIDPISGDIFLAAQSDILIRIDPVAKAVRRVYTIPKVQTRCIAFYPDGKLMMNFGDNTNTIFDAVAGTFSGAYSAVIPSQPNNFAYNVAAGAMYACYNGGSVHSISKLDTSGNIVATIAGTDTCSFLVYNPYNGLMYAIDATTNNVVKMNATTLLLSTNINAYTNQQIVLVDKYLYISNTTQLVLYKYDVTNDTYTFKPYVGVANGVTKFMAYASSTNKIYISTGGDANSPAFDVVLDGVTNTVLATNGTTGVIYSAIANVVFSIDNVGTIRYYI